MNGRNKIILIEATVILKGYTNSQCVKIRQK